MKRIFLKNLVFSRKVLMCEFHLHKTGSAVIIYLQQIVKQNKPKDYQHLPCKQLSTCYRPKIYKQFKADLPWFGYPRRPSSTFAPCGPSCSIPKLRIFVPVVRGSRLGRRGSACKTPGRVFRRFQNIEALLHTLILAVFHRRLKPEVFRDQTNRPLWSARGLKITIKLRNLPNQCHIDALSGFSSKARSKFNLISSAFRNSQILPSTINPTENKQQAYQ